MNNEQADVTIRISDLFAALLKRIKPIIALVLALALLGALFGVYKAMHTASRVTEKDITAAEKSLKKAQDKVITSETTLNKLLEFDIPNAESTVERAKRTVQRQQDYMDNSLYYAMDPFHRGVSRVTLYVETNVQTDPEKPWLTADPQSSIVSAFTKMYPFDSDLLNDVRRIMNTDAERRFISELVSVTNSSDQFVIIRAYNEDAEVAKEVTDYLLNTLQERLTKTVGNFTSQVISYYVGYEVDWTMSENHDQEDEKLFTAQTDLYNAEQNLQKLESETRINAELAIEKNKTAVEEAEAKLQDLQERFASAKITPKNVTKRAVRYAVLFSAAGLFGACFLIFLNKVLSGRLQDINDVLSRYSFPLIGTLPTKKKRLFERTIRKLEGEPDFDYETAGKSAAQSLLSVVGDRRIAYVSSLGPEAAEELQPFTGDRIPVCGDLLKDAEAVKAAKDYDGFVLVEKRGSSRFDLIDAEARRIKSLGKQTEGIILL